MYPFEEHLQYIHGQISIKQEDRQPYTRIFDTVRNWLLRSLCQVDPIFRKLYTGTCLFGSYVNRVRIIKPSEFDVFIVLKFPYEIDTFLDKNRPGFVHLDLENTLEDLADDPNYYDVYAEFYDRVNNQWKLKNNSFQWWINDIIEEVIATYSAPCGYVIQYEKHNVAHNIYVRERYSNRTVSIDFVPAIRLNREEWMQSFYDEDIDSFLAIPKRLHVRNTRNKNITFQLVNPEAERDILWDKQNLKAVYRLLKSLRNEFGLRRIKSYFLTAIFLWEVENTEDDDYWRNDVGDIFVDMLGRLSDYFDNGYLPYYWAKGFNLLSILKPKEITQYAATLDDIWKTLKTYPPQPKLGFLKTAYYFEFP